MSVPRSQLERTVLAFRQALVRGDEAAQRAIVRSLALAEANLLPVADALEAEILALGDAATPDAVRRLSTYTELLDQIDVELTTLGRSTGSLIAAQATTAATAGANAALAAAQAVGGARVGVAWNRLPAAAIRELTASVTGGPLGTLLDGFGVAGRETAERILLDGLTRGPGPRAVGDALDGALGIGRNRAQVIARTEILRAGKQANLASYAANPSVIGGWTWNAKRGANTCSACLIMDGTAFPATVTFFPGHPQCRCVPSPIVRGFPPIERTTGREYLQSLPESEQRRILGSAKYDAWQRGEVELDDLVTVRTSETWGDSYQPASLNTARAQAAGRSRRAG